MNERELQFMLADKQKIENEYKFSVFRKRYDERNEYKFYEYFLAFWLNKIYVIYSFPFFEQMTSVLPFEFLSIFLFSFLIVIELFFSVLGPTLYTSQIFCIENLYVSYTFLFCFKF